MLTFLIIIFFLSYPLSHLLMKKGLMLDNKPTEKKYKVLKVFFYLPMLNFLISFSYLILSVIKFKRDFEI
jgi:hypothetical protein